MTKHLHRTGTIQTVGSKIPIQSVSSHPHSRNQKGGKGKGKTQSPMAKFKKMIPQGASY